MTKWTPRRAAFPSSAPAVEFLGEVDMEGWLVMVLVLFGMVLLGFAVSAELRRQDRAREKRKRRIISVINGRDAL